MGYSIGNNVSLKLITGLIVEGVVIEVYGYSGIKVDNYGVIWEDDVEEYFI